MVDLSDPNGKMAAFIKRVPMGRGGKDTVFIVQVSNSGHCWSRATFVE
jgi:hypothetical protein